MPNVSIFLQKCHGTVSVKAAVVLTVVIASLSLTAVPSALAARSHKAHEPRAVSTATATAHRGSRTTKRKLRSARRNEHRRLVTKAAKAKRAKRAASHKPTTTTVSAPKAPVVQSPVSKTGTQTNPTPASTTTAGTPVKTGSGTSTPTSTGTGAGTPVTTSVPGEVDTSHPTQVIGDGEPASCTSAAVVSAVAAGGIITFNCGPNPLTITMNSTADVTKTDHLVVLDGGGLITLNGGGQRQILFSDTCQGTLSTSDCVNQPYPQVVVQNITFQDGYSGAQQNMSCTQNAPTCWYGGVDGGGAIYAEGGQFKAVNSTFIDNGCYADGPDLGGGAIRALAQYANLPVYITDDTFSGNSCSNGGALSSISVGWDISDSQFTDNSAVGWGANPAATGTPGGGSGGAIYLDGKNDNVQIDGTTMTGNTATEGGGAVFDTVDSGYGALTFDGSQLDDDISGVFQTAPGVYDQVDGYDTAPTLIDTTDN
jgi:hypothetical protein